MSTKIHGNTSIQSRVARLLRAREIEVYRMRRLREDIVQKIKKLSHTLLLLCVLQPLRELQASGVVLVKLSRWVGQAVRSASIPRLRVAYGVQVACQCSIRVLNEHIFTAFPRRYHASREIRGTSSVSHTLCSRYFPQYKYP